MKFTTCLGIVFLGAFVCYSLADVNFQFDLSKPTTPFPHFWEQCVGSGHALLALRADYQKYLTRVRKDLGFQHVRFHGILDDDMSTYTVINGAPATSFFNIDQIFDFLLSINMKPYFEISFMPDLLASGNTTVFHYEGNTTPPTSYADWNQLISAILTHLIERYGIDEVRTWPFEVWNEPNCGFWTGSQQDYFTLYQNTANAIKSVDPLLIVGGPATCQSQWIPEFLNFTNLNNVPVDFVSTHEYPTDVTPPLLSLQSIVATARQQAGSLPLYYSEYNDGLYNPSYHDTSYAAAFIAKNVHDVQGYVDLWSWWTFSDIFEEQGFSSIPFYDPNGWGLLNRYGIPKPTYRAFQLLHTIGTDQVASSSSDPNSSLQSYGIVQTTEANKQRITIVAYNIFVPTETNTTSVVGQFQVSGFPNGGSSIPSSATVYLIDQDHCNPAQAWLNMGSPAYLNPAQINLLEIASEVPVISVPLTVQSGVASFSVNMIPQSLAFITIDF